MGKGEKNLHNVQISGTAKVWKISFHLEMLWFNGKGGHFVGTPSLTNTPPSPPFNSTLLAASYGENNNLDVLNYSSNTKGTHSRPTQIPSVECGVRAQWECVRLPQAIVGFRTWFRVCCSPKERTELSLGLHLCWSRFYRARPRQGSLSWEVPGLGTMRKTQREEHEAEFLDLLPSSAINEASDLG